MPIWIFFYYLNIYYEKFRDPIYLPLVWTFPLANKENCSMPKLCLCKLSRQLDPKGNSDLSLWNCVAELLDTKFMFRVVNLSMLGFTSCFLSSFRLRRDSIVNEGLRSSSQGWPVRIRCSGSGHGRCKFYKCIAGSQPNRQAKFDLLWCSCNLAFAKRSY